MTGCAMNWPSWPSRRLSATASAGTQIGPLQNKMQYDKIKDYLEVAHQDGKVIAGGAATKGKGYFVPPTIVRDIADDSRLVAEEHSPVLPVIKYDDVGDVIERANETDFDLAARSGRYTARL